MTSFSLTLCVIYFLTVLGFVNVEFTVNLFPFLKTQSTQSEDKKEVNQMHSFRSVMLIPFLNHYYDYMKYSITCLKKISGTLKFNVLQFRLILNSLQNYSMMISTTQNF